LLYVPLFVACAEETEECEDGEVDGGGVGVVGVCEAFHIGVEMVVAELLEGSVFWEALLSRGP
jgi:hypothetical protein